MECRVFFLLALDRPVRQSDERSIDRFFASAYLNLAIVSNT